jgi:hypothetical protein
MFAANNSFQRATKTFGVAATGRVERPEIYQHIVKSSACHLFLCLCMHFHFFIIAGGCNFCALKKKNEKDRSPIGPMWECCVAGTKEKNKRAGIVRFPVVL